MDRPHAHAARREVRGGEPEFLPLGVAVLTVSDTRDTSTDSSGRLLEERVTSAGHRCVERLVVRDEIEAIRGAVLAWCERPGVQVVLVTGGTGLATRDRTPEALEPLFEKHLPGFGELFRWLSFREIGTATIQSRASAGLIRGRLVFCLPGAPAACRLAMDEILLPQLDARTRPCSFSGLLWQK